MLPDGVPRSLRDLIKSYGERITRLERRSSHTASSGSGGGGDTIITNAPACEPYLVSRSGNLTVVTGVLEVLMSTSYDLVSIKARVVTPSSGSSIILDVKKNGASIFSNPAHRPTITAGGHNSTTTVPTLTFATNDYLSVDIDQVGSGTAGADLVVVIRVRENS